MGQRKGIIYAALERLDQLMAVGESRFAAKEHARAHGEATWAFSSGRIHSYSTRASYQEHVLHFINWARDTQHIRRLEHLDARADELACAYLCERIARGYSAWTLAAERSALRLFFQDRTLASQVILPQRRRGQIRRSRGPVAQDAHFQPGHWLPLLHFLEATGLRRKEVRALLVGDISWQGPERLVVHVARGKGGKARDVSVLPGREGDVLQVIAGRSPQERVFARLPVHLDIHALRRQYALALYQGAARWPLPAPPEPLSLATIDLEAARLVTRALGHNRVDVLLKHYLQ